MWLHNKWCNDQIQKNHSTFVILSDFITALVQSINSFTGLSLHRENCFDGIHAEMSNDS